MKNTKKSNEGFTLIELLVVVAIIGILASVVLASLNSARAKGADAKIKSQLNNMRAQSLLWGGTGAIVAAQSPCPTNIANSIFASGNDSLYNLFDGLTMANTRCASDSTGTNWAVAAITATGAWCVDSNGTGRDKNATGTSYLGASNATTLTNAISASPATSCN